MSTQNIKVAVRVRPFSDREKSRKSQLIISMNQNTTFISDPQHLKEKPRNFTFDHSYWSHDGFKVDESGYCRGESNSYIDQVKVFNDLGLGMLENAWNGYNCSIFAYGQTGSGKSYSIMGHGANKGLVPRVCEALFTEIEARKKTRKGVSYEVSFSMLEIYNEQIRDLFNKNRTPPGGLKLKEGQKGFFVEGLYITPVGSFRDIQLRLKEGDRQRTIAATKMNETSSRAHTIVNINFTQNNIAEKTSKLSTISLVDLAGSERAKQTEATGDRFEESKNINKSLMTLGNTIKALCDKAKGKNTHVPYRDSVLTKLLKNTLGGNSKTVMIAAISPDAENYEQTLSTLKYADRAKSIQTVAKVNQEATNKIIQDLIAEKERLLKELEKQKGGQSGYTDEDIQRIRKEQEEEIRNYKDQMLDIEKAWERKLADARKEIEEIRRKEQEAEEEEKRTPHLSNLNEDPALSGKLMHMIRKGRSILGNNKNENKPDIILNGPRISKEHACFENANGEVTLKPYEGQQVLYNGKELKTNVVLQHQDRLRFGSNNLFVFVHPLQALELKKKQRVLREITYEFAQSEIAKHSGLNIDEGDSVLQQEVMSIMQVVQDVNAMSEEMKKSTEFAILLMSPEARGLEKGRTEICIKVADHSNGNEYVWDRNKFLNRQVHMQELYRSFDESGEIPQVSKEKDPFWEPADTPVMLGVVSVPLNYLSHMIEFIDEPVTIIDHRAKQTGFLKVDVVPCDGKGNEDADVCVEDPTDLVNTKIAFKVKIHQAMNLPERFVKTWCQYRFYDDPDFIKTSPITGPNPSYSHEHLFKLGRSQVDHKFIDYLREKSMPIEVWGEQDNSGNESSSAKIPRPEGRQKLLEDVQKLQRENEKLKDALNDVRHIAKRSKGDPNMKDILKIIKTVRKEVE